MNQGRRVDAISETYVEEYAALDPIAATYLGIAGHDDRLTDLSPDGFAARESLTRNALAEARDATPVDEREQVAREAFLERLGLEADDEARVRQGSAFDLKAFHRAALDLGSIGLDPLKAALARL